METGELLTPLLFVVLSLMAGAAIKYLLRRCSFPYTVGLFCFGLLLGLLDRCGLLDNFGLLRDTISTAGAIDPDLIIYIFLPLLIFDAAYELNTHIFRKTIVNATLLAVPGVVVSMLLTAGMMVLIGRFVPGCPEWSWTVALMFGALISTTDPVAVVALLRELGTSKRFSTLVDAESMLNDGTGIVLFMLFFGSFVSASTLCASPVGEFCLVVVGGGLVGWVFARLTLWFISKVRGDSLVQNSAVIVSAYVTFLLTQGYLQVSGVIALVAFGLTIAHVGKPLLRPEVNGFMKGFWELTSYIANTLIFIIVGVVIATHVDVTWSNLAIMVGVYAGINIIRSLMILMLYPLMKRCGYGLSVRESIILSWGGLRGALGLTMALMVASTLAIPEDIRKQILLFTAGIVTLTLTINATTIRRLLTRLGMLHVSTARQLLDYGIRKRIRESMDDYYGTLRRREMLADADWSRVDDFLPEAETAPEADDARKNLRADLRLRVLDREKSILHKLYDEGVVSEPTYRTLTESLNDLYDYDGTRSLGERASIEACFDEPLPIRYSRQRPKLRAWIDRHCRRWVVRAYDLGRGFVIVERESLKFADELAEMKILDAAGAEAETELKIIRSEIERNIAWAEERVGCLRRDFPVSYRQALTIKSARMLLSYERRVVARFVDDGLLGESEYERLRDAIDLRADRLKHDAGRWVTW